MSFGFRREPRSKHLVALGEGDVGPEHVVLLVERTQLKHPTGLHVYAQAVQR